MLIVATIMTLILGAIVQVSIGFGAALIAIPALLWLGWSLPESQVLLVTAMLGQNVVGLRNVPSDVRFRDSIAPGLVRAAFIPMGLIALLWLVQLPTVQLKAIVGAMLLGALAAQALKRRGSGEPPKAFWKWTAFSVSGFLQGSIGMSGPPLVLWAYAMPWSVDRARALLFGVYLIGYPFQIGLWFWSFGEEILNAWLLGFAMAPLVIGAAFLGVRLRKRVSETRLRRVVIALLLLIACSNISFYLFAQSI
jgi:uncharacterized membrane protein YfcA